MLKPTIYGFAHHNDVDDAIANRVQECNPDSKQELALLLGEMVAVITDINRSVPYDSEERHLVAGPLEKLANGG